MTPVVVLNPKQEIHGVSTWAPSRKFVESALELHTTVIASLGTIPTPNFVNSCTDFSQTSKELGLGEMWGMAQENLTNRKKKCQESSRKCKLIGQCFLLPLEKLKLIWSEGIMGTVCLANHSSPRMWIIMIGQTTIQVTFVKSKEIVWSAIVQVFALFGKT